MLPLKRFAALDTRFLLALCVGDEDCQTVIDWLSANKVYPLATGTVLQELADLEREDSDKFVRQNAENAQSQLSTWGILPAPLSSIDNGIAKIIATRLVEKKVLPDDAENDGLVVVEAAMHQCKILITYREGLLNAHSAGIRFMLIENDVSDLFIVSPEDVVEYLREFENEPSEVVTPPS
jgi:rRNA-processing protein FCF1